MPDGMCRNILYASVLSHTDVEVHEIMHSKTNSKKGLAPKTCIALGTSFQDIKTKKKYFERAIDLGGNNIVALQKRAEIAVKEGDRKYAKNLLSQAIAAQGGFSQARSTLQES